MGKENSVKPLSEIIKYRKLFNNNKFKGEVLTRSSILEDLLDSALTQYFIRDDKYPEGLRLISSLNFEKKIQVFSQLPIRKKANHKRAILGLRAFQRIRNIAAHSHHVFANDIQILLRDQRALAALSNFPINMSKLHFDTQISILRLMETKSFQNKNAKKQLLDSDFLQEGFSEIHSMIFENDEDV